jgi:hypothetical protein
MNTSYKFKKTRKRLGIYDNDKVNRAAWFVITKDDREVKPGIYLFKFCSLFRFGIVIFWLISAALMLTNCSSSYLKEDLASKYFSNTSVLTQVSANVVSSVASVPDMKVKELWSDRQEKLLFIDFNTEKVCGKLGCAYNLFLSKNDELNLVWSGYLDPYLPPQVKLLTVKPVDEKRQQYPCLIVNQLDSVQSRSSADSPTIKEVTLCKSGEKYQVENTRSFRL